MADLEKEIMHVEPDSIGYKEYFDHLIAYNKILHAKIGSEIARVLAEPYTSFAIASTGSDARLEKGPVSLVEVILFGENTPHHTAIGRKMIDYVCKPREMRFFEDHLEVKPLDSNMCESIITSCNKEPITMNSPNRVLDARMLYGNEENMAIARAKLSNDVKSEYGKKAIDRNKDKIRNFRKVTLTGRQTFRSEPILHFDDTTAYYNPGKFTWSFKQGPLRLVQFALVRDILAGLKEGVPMYEISALSTNTVQKLNELNVMDRLAIEQSRLTDLCDSYKYFLWLYHRSQHLYQSIGEERLDISCEHDIRDRLASLEETCKEKIIKF